MRRSEWSPRYRCTPHLPSEVRQELEGRLQHACSVKLFRRSCQCTPDCPITGTTHVTHRLDSPSGVKDHQDASRLEGWASRMAQSSVLHDYLLLLLSDSNLPTGGFVASSGLESSTTHGFFQPASSANQLLAFLRLSLSSYARLALPFLFEAWQVSSDLGSSAMASAAADSIAGLDDLYDAMLLNHVARRASQAQGIALLTLYTKSFADRTDAAAGSGAKSSLVKMLKAKARGQEAIMHLPICFAVLTGCLGLPSDKAAHLHLFLHARSILSSAVRLNSIGPYAAQSLLYHDVRPLIESVLSNMGGMRLSAEDRRLCGLIEDTEASPGQEGPAMTWPLGEILGTRHDSLHVRLFNS